MPIAYWVSYDVIQFLYNPDIKFGYDLLFADEETVSELLRGLPGFHNLRQRGRAPLLLYIAFQEP